MEKQETRMKLKLEMEMEMEVEIGNGNGNKKHTNHCCNVFFIMCLVITVVFNFSNSHMTGFMGNALPLLLYCA